MPYVVAMLLVCTVWVDSLLLEIQHVWQVHPIKVSYAAFVVKISKVPISIEAMIFD